MKLNQVVGNIDAREENVHIWGAGFSGLILGFYLKQRGFKVSIYEKDHRIGGKIGTFKNNFGLFEIGANAFYMNADAMDLFNELGLEVLPATKKLKRYLFHQGKFKSPFSFSLFSHVILHLMKKPPLITEGLTVAEFFRPLLGDYYLETFLSPILSGIYSSSAGSLHFRSLFHELDSISQFKSYKSFFSSLLKKKRKAPKLEVKGSVSFDGGMQTLINKLGEALKDEIKLNYHRPFQLRTNTILCTDAIVAADLLKEMRPDVSQELRRIDYQSLTTTTLFLQRELKTLHKSFGALIPHGQGLQSIGLLNNKHIFPSNNENVFSYTLITPGNISRESIFQDLRKMASTFSDNEVEHMESTFWEKGLPLYNLQRYLAIKKLHQILHQEKGLALFGNYVAGISLREMTSAAKLFAQSL